MTSTKLFCFLRIIFIPSSEAPWERTPRGTLLEVMSGSRVRRLKTILNSYLSQKRKRSIVAARGGIAAATPMG
jgi:hypothetical protein